MTPKDPREAVEIALSRLSSAAIQTRLKEIPAWALHEGKLRREFHFRDFVAAFAFMSEVARVAESSSHHPEWLNVYNRVRVDLVTHDAGGITPLDFQLAREMDRLFALAGSESNGNPAPLSDPPAE